MRGQQGMFLLQSLVAIALFSIGALAVMMLSASAMRLSAEAHYRTVASVLASRMAAQIRLGPRDAASLDALVSGDGAQAFRNAAAEALPGAGENPPRIDIDAAGGVTITVRWQAPGDTSVHQYVALTRIVE